MARSKTQKPVKGVGNKITTVQGTTRNGVTEVLTTTLGGIVNSNGYGYRFEVSDRVRKLREGRIAISTHGRSVNRGRLACDLLIIDEAHRAKNDGSLFAKELRRQRDDVGQTLILTATPFSIAPAELSRMLDLVGADRKVSAAINRAANALETLWKGKFSDLGFAMELAGACSSAIEAIQPFVIRHGVATLPAREREICSAQRTFQPWKAIPRLLAKFKFSRALTGRWSSESARALGV